MGPVVSKLENDYAGRVEVRRRRRDEGISAWDGSRSVGAVLVRANPAGPLPLVPEAGRMSSGQARAMTKVASLPLSGRPREGDFARK